MTKITAIIITYNEEKHIATCIDSLIGIADEIVVIDSFSKDKTKTIAESKGAKVAEKEFIGFGAQKNMGADLAANDYILSIDADEVLSEQLKQSILNLKVDISGGAYYVNRLNHLGSKPIRTCGWYPDTRIRLYDRHNAHWDNKEVHEELIVKDRPVFLSGDLLHYSFEDFADMKRRGDQYAALGAEELKKTNAVVFVFKMLVNPIAKFIKTYFIQEGFKDGHTGWMISWYKTRETFLKYYWALR